MTAQRSIVIANLAASPFLGGAERQMLGLARHLPAPYRSVFFSFAERGLARPFLEQARAGGYEAVELRYNVPQVRQAVHEIVGHLRRVKADVLCCHGYKPDVIGWRAARLAGIPVVSVSHGWTAVTLKVRAYEILDRLVLRWMDRIVGVSAAQADKVLRAGVASERVTVIRNAIAEEAFAPADPFYAERLRDLFPDPPARIVGGIGRLSPEKGFDQLVRAAELACRDDARLGFVVFGDGPLRSRLAEQICRLGLERRFILAGFRADVGKYLPHLDLVVLPSFTEGLPVVLLEAFAAGVPVVATRVGGTPEVIEEGVSGFLVPPGDPPALAKRICDALRDDQTRRTMGERGRERVRCQFTFDVQSQHYQRLFADLLSHRAGAACVNGHAAATQPAGLETCPT